MSNREDIADQIELLSIYRRALSNYRKRYLSSRDADRSILLEVVHSIRETQDNIRRIKDVLRTWGVVVEDYADDELLTLEMSEYAPLEARSAISHFDSRLPVHQSLTFPTSNRRLADLGFHRDPFAFPDAETMDLDALEETFVVPPGFDEYIMDLSRSAVLLAPRGGGKTAGRQRLEAYLSRGIGLAVVYKDFERIVDRLPDVGLDDHTEPLLAAIAEAISTFILSHAQTFLALQDTERDWWWAFLEVHLKGMSLTFRVQANHHLSQDYQGRTTARPKPFHSGSTLLSILDSLQKPLISLGIDRMYILVDEVDGYVQTQSLSNLEALVAPLLNTLSLFSLSNCVWKLFLPTELERLVHSSAGYNTGRLYLVLLQWDELSLIQFLRQRLVWASDSRVLDIAQLCDQPLLSTVDVERELVRMALRHRRLGPPRALLDLGSRLLRSRL